MSPVTICFVAVGVGLAAGVVPLVSLELFLAGAAVLLPPTARAALVSAAVLGHVAGRSFVYLGARQATRVSSARVERAVERVGGRLRGRPGAGFALIAGSAAVSLPPFTMTCLAAGAIRFPYPAFVTASAIGMVLRYAAVVAIPGVLMR